MYTNANKMAARNFFARQQGQEIKKKDFPSKLFSLRCALNAKEWKWCQTYFERKRLSQHDEGQRIAPPFRHFKIPETKSNDEILLFNTSRTRNVIFTKFHSPRNYRTKSQTGNNQNARQFCKTIIHVRGNWIAQWK